PHLSCSLSSDPPPTDTYPLSLHDALPISALPWAPASRLPLGLNVRCSYRWSMMSFASLVLALAKGAALGVLELAAVRSLRVWCRDRKSTRLNSSHVKISYAVFCLKKKNTD